MWEERQTAKVQVTQKTKKAANGNSSRALSVTFLEIKHIQVPLTPFSNSTLHSFCFALPKILQL